jgi:hypothetical protein
MGKFGEIVEDFYTERTRILEALSQPENKHMVMRLIGALAFRTHCPQYGYIQDKLGREFTDFDFASYPRFFKDIVRVLSELGYREDKQVTQLFGDTRMIFHDPAFGRHIDVFYNKLEFCHTITYIGRLELEQYTLPLAELLLEKMQIVRINEKDLIDSVMLLREHPIGEVDKETINANVIARTLGNDWGFWRTVTGNLKELEQALQRYTQLTDEDRQVVHDRIKELEQRLESQPKTLRWKARAKVGEKVKWYKDVEEMSR